MSAPNMTLAELQAKIAKRAWEDPMFEAEFMADPKATFEKYTGNALPSELAIHAHYNTPSELHFILPKRVQSPADELTDEDLERVAGGELFVASAVILIVATVTAITTQENW